MGTFATLLLTRVEKEAYTMKGGRFDSYPPSLSWILLTAIKYVPSSTSRMGWLTIFVLDAGEQAERVYNASAGPEGGVSFRARSVSVG